MSSLKRAGLTVLREIAVTPYGIGPLLVVVLFLYLATEWWSA